MINKYMMATKAIHKMGDISNDTPDLCFISSEDDANYIGNWVFGYGFVDVKFPKDTTKELTADDIEKYHGELCYIGGSCVGVINLTDEKFDKHVTLTKSDGSKTYEGILFTPIKIGKSIGLRTNNGNFITTSIVVKLNGNEIHTKNSIYILK